MDLLFLTGIFPKEKETEILQNSKGNVQNAANVLQWNLINGLDECLGKVSLLNAVFIGSYPNRYKKLFIPSYEFSHIEGAKDYNVGFCNLMGYKRFSRRKNINKQVKKWAKDNTPDKVLMAYAMTDSSVSALKCAKKANKAVKTCLIVPDLPEFMSMRTNSNKIYKILKKIDRKRLYDNLKYVDSYTVLTEQMATWLNIKNYTVVEGTASDVFKDVERGIDKNRTIVYAGSLAEKYGIVDLIDAFKTIPDKELRLVICGKGDAEKYVIKATQEDDRIKYAGMLLRDDVLKTYLSSSVLVNPRKNEGEYTKYSFPSKILEYLSSGVPVVAYKLDGMPNEYANYINYVPDNTTESFAKILREVAIDKDGEYKKKALKASEFVKQEKSAKRQVEKILKMINSL